MRSSRLALFEPSPVSPVSDTHQRTLPEEILLLRYGSNSYTKNGLSGEIIFTEEDAETILADFQKRGKDLVIDYEHQSLSGSKAPAAGWIDSLEKTASGLLARIKYWTKEAEEFLLRGEYRYFSPTFCFSRKGKSLSAIHSVALTNHPAMHGIDPLTAGDLALSADDEEAGEKEEEAEFTYPDPNSTPEQEDLMDGLLEKASLLSLVSSDGAAKKAALIAHLDALQKKAEKAETFLHEHNFASFHDAEDALKKAACRERDQMLEKAFEEGKLMESMREWAEALADTAPELFRKWLETAPRILPCNEVPSLSCKGKSKALLFSDEEEKIFAMLGLTPHEVGKSQNTFSGNEN